VCVCVRVFFACVCVPVSCLLIHLVAGLCLIPAHWAFKQVPGPCRLLPTGKLSSPPATLQKASLPPTSPQPPPRLPRPLSHAPRMQVAADSWKKPQQTTSDFVSAICANDAVLMVGRTSGVVQRYSLPHLTVEVRAGWPEQVVGCSGWCGWAAAGCVGAAPLPAPPHCGGACGVLEAWGLLGACSVALVGCCQPLGAAVC